MTFWTICDVAGFAAGFHAPFSGVPKIEMRYNTTTKTEKLPYSVFKIVTP